MNPNPNQHPKLDPTPNHPPPTTAPAEPKRKRPAKPKRAAQAQAPPSPPLITHVPYLRWMWRWGKKESGSWFLALDLDPLCVLSFGLGISLREPQLILLLPMVLLVVGRDRCTERPSKRPRPTTTP